MTTEGIMNAIDSGEANHIENVKFFVKRKTKEVNCPEILLRQLRVYEKLLSKSSGSLPYRQQIQLKAITQALAIMRGNSEITQEDIDTVTWLSKWINYDFKEI